MDDDHALECQLELMHALQNRPPLRRIPTEDLPSRLGGHKEVYTTPRPLDLLQAEFLHGSLAMQMRLRPRLEIMSEIRDSNRDNEQWAKLQRELRRAAKEKEGKFNDCPKLLFQIQNLVERKPGWVDLQRQVRECNQKSLLVPVDVDGFLVIRGSSKQSHSKPNFENEFVDFC